MSNNENSADTGRRVMHIRYRERDEQRAHEVLQAMDRGEGDTVEPFFEVTCHRMDDFEQAIRPKNLQLLRAIAEAEPESIRETARVVERDVHQVHTNLKELDELHLIDFEAVGNSKRPRVWYNEIEVHYPLTPDIVDDQHEVSA